MRGGLDQRQERITLINGFCGQVRNYLLSSGSGCLTTPVLRSAVQEAAANWGTE
jgi:hypothetical protein